MKDAEREAIIRVLDENGEDKYEQDANGKDLAVVLKDT